MAKIKYDVSNVEDSPGFEHVPPGMYIGKVVEINEKESKSGNGPMLEVIIQPVKDAKGKKLKPKDKKKQIARVYTYVLLAHEPSEWKLKEFVNAFGLKPKGSIDTGKLIGEEVQMNLKPDTDLDDNYRPRVGKLVALAEKASKTDDDDDDQDDDAGADDDDDDADDDDTYSEEDLAEQDDDELRETAEEFDLDPDDYVSEKGKGKKKKSVLDRDALISAIIEAQEESDDDDDDSDDDDDDDDSDDGDYTADDIDEMDLDELKEVIEEEELDVKVETGKGKKKKDRDLEDIASDVKEALGIEDDDDDDDDDDDAGDGDDDDEDVDYTTWSMEDLKKEATERGLSTKGSKKVLAGRLAKDDEDDNPF